MAANLKAIAIFLVLFLILLVSFLLVILNTDFVVLDLFGFASIEQPLGMLLLFAFVSGILFSLLLVFLPNQMLSWRNKRLQKQLAKK